METYVLRIAWCVIRVAKLAVLYERLTFRIRPNKRPIVQAVPRNTQHAPSIPFRMKDPLFIHTLIGMRTEEISLRLNQIRG